MDLNLAKEIRFYSGKEVRDALVMADRILHRKKRDHWNVYGSYFIALFLLCMGFKKISSSESLPVVTMSEVKDFLSKPVDEQKEFLLNVSMIYMPDAVYDEVHDILQKVLNTKSKECESCVQSALEGFNEFFGNN